jgi:hypothetical protein
MTTPQIAQHDAETNETVVRDMTPEEIELILNSSDNISPA